MRSELEAIDPDGLPRATAAVAVAIATQYGSGAFEAELSALVVEARRPA
jgi:hypothetical protein